MKNKLSLNKDLENKEQIKKFPEVRKIKMCPLNNHILAIHEVPKLKSEKLIPQSYKIDPI